MGSNWPFVLFVGGWSSEKSPVDATVKTLILAVFVLPGMAWMTSITPKGGEIRFPFLLSPQPRPPIPWLYHELLQVSCFHKLPQMVFQYSTLLGCMHFIPVVSTIQVLISPRGIPSHLFRPPEERLVFNLIYDLVHWLLERYIYLP